MSQPSLHDATAVLRARANYALDDHDPTQFSQTLEQQQSELSAIEEVVSRLEGQLLKACSQREELRNSIFLHKQLVKPSPIRRIPPEILSYILSLHSASFVDLESIQLHTEDDLNHLILQIRRSQNLLLSVCRLWSQVVLSDCRCWQLAVVFHPNQLSSEEEREDHWKCIEKRLAFAGDSAPITLVLSPSPKNGGQPDTVDQCREAAILQTVGARLSRLVSMPKGLHLLHLLQNDTAHNALEKITIVWPSGNWESTITKLVSTLPYLSGLLSLSIQHSRYVLPMLGGKIASATIRRLHLPPMRKTDILKMLENTPQLRHLRITKIVEAARLPKRPIVFHPNLQSLVVTYGGQNFDMLCLTTLPSLQYLDVLLAPNWPRPKVDFDFFERSGYPIKQLSLSGCRAAGLPELLHSLPNLSRIALRENPEGLHFLLNKLASDAPIFPKSVVELTFPETHRGRYHVDELKSALEGILARQEEYGLSCIRTANHRDEALQPVIQKLVEAGISVTGGVYDVGH
ncbi:hypothetical protein CYLTODRAFT_485442 [Cylindrobasidium torrendii FP15055 ss-10]|uniref:F-box domain-containing protein n=1 Tax=Cylindrobasidium torrendii FP15055 ss-10 TaxID=1314674 RepID=A0A0D7BT46_9AGAR|nr:hypothetical protein CYLTODRAFT_485442 [Cylindrobasidium torrendii FP15055 ss-10]